MDAAETLSAIMVNDLSDPVRFLELLGDLIVAATEAAKGKHPRVSVFGECVHLLWAQGNAEAAIQMENRQQAHQDTQRGYFLRLFSGHC